MKVIETFPGNADFVMFEQVPSQIYSEDELQLKATESISQKYLVTCFVILEDEKPIGRVSLYVNPELQYEGKHTACFGSYECIENQNVVRALLHAAENKAKELKAEFLIGPMNGSTWENYRFSTNHDHANFFLEPYHHLYYNEQFSQNGFETIAEYYSLLDKEVVFKIPGAKENEVRFSELGFTFRNVDLENFDADLGAIHDLNEIAFRTNFLYTPISKAEFMAKYNQAKQFIQAEFLRLAFNERNELVGYYFCTPDFFNKNEKSLIIKSIARNPEERYRGLGQAIGNQIYNEAQKQGYSSVIHAFMHQQGTSARLSNQFSNNHFKNYRLYGKAI